MRWLQTGLLAGCQRKSFPTTCRFQSNVPRPRRRHRFHHGLKAEEDGGTEHLTIGCSMDACDFPLSSALGKFYVFVKLIAFAFFSSKVQSSEATFSAIAVQNGSSSISIDYSRYSFDANRQELREDDVYKYQSAGLTARTTGLGKMVQYKTGSKQYGGCLSGTTTGYYAYELRLSIHVLFIQAGFETPWTQLHRPFELG